MFDKKAFESQMSSILALFVMYAKMIYSKKESL